jgi:hypothetical protein
MDLVDVIKTRKSCRTFREVFLDPADKNILEEYINNIRDKVGGEDHCLRIVEKAVGGNRLELNYGMITGHNTYVLGSSKSSPDARVHYGYIMEKVVLKATEIGVSSCWIGYFDASHFSVVSSETGYEIPGIVILGYQDERRSRAERITRFAVKASQRFEWQKLFFDFNSGIPLNPDTSNVYSLSLEMVRLAPSAGNTQPWRIFSDDYSGEFHFFKKPVSRRYEERGLHDIDLGIAIAHFELASEYKELPGIWIRKPGISVSYANDLQYVITWKCG